jgi:carbon monoxide dehydrogenase subunit G
MADWASATYLGNMARYTTSVQTPLPPAEAFAAVADASRFAEWDPGVKRSVRVAGAGIGVGTAYDITVSSGGATMRYEVKECDAPRRILLTSKTSLLKSVDEISVRPVGTGSVVTYDARLTLNGLGGLFDPLLGLAFRRIGDRAAAGLREFLKGTAVAS